MINHDTGPGRPFDGGSVRAGGPAGFEPIEADRWHWTFSDDADVAVDAVAPLFDSQASAEDWLTQNVDGLVDQGVAAVTLFDGDGAVYGPMSLAADDAANDTGDADDAAGPAGTAGTMDTSTVDTTGTGGTR
jgi:hypothetical protein